MKVMRQNQPHCKYDETELASLWTRNWQEQDLCDCDETEQHFCGTNVTLTVSFCGGAMRLTLSLTAFLKSLPHGLWAKLPTNLWANLLTAMRDGLFKEKLGRGRVQPGWGESCYSYCPPPQPRSVWQTQKPAKISTVKKTAWRFGPEDLVKTKFIIIYFFYANNTRLLRID